MEDWFGLTPTGRELKEPTGKLVELVDDEDVLCLGIEFDPHWHGHPSLVRSVSLIRSFLEYPMVVGLVELTHADVERGRFVYPTGPVLTVKEILRAYSDLGHSPGARAALELLYLAGQIADEAAATGAMQGCFSHGGLTPWRVTVRDDANVQIVGHGLPQLDLLEARGNPSAQPDSDSLRYAPPERLSGHPEDQAADTAALVIIGYEVMTGQPLYPGHDPAEIARSASISEAVPMLSRPNSLPRDIAQVFARSLVFDPDSRLRGPEWLREIAGLLETHRDGEGLAEVVARVRGTAVDGTRRAKIRQTAETGSYAPAALAAMAESAADPEVDGDRPARWQKVDRTARRSEGTAAEPADGDNPSRRRRRDRPMMLVVPEEVATPGADLPLLDLDELDDEEDDDLVLEVEENDDAPSRPRLRRRLDTANVPRPPRTPPNPTAPATAAPPDDPPTQTMPGRRRRRNDPG